MNRLSSIAALVALAIFVTFLMFLIALITQVLGTLAIFFVLIICIPVVCILLCGMFAMMFVLFGNVLNTLKLKRQDEEHHYQVLEEKRELDLQQRKLQVHEYHLHLSRSVYSPRSPRLKGRLPENLIENGC